MDSSEIHSAADANYCDAMVLMAGCAVKGAVDRTDEHVMMHCGLPVPPFNLVFSESGAFPLYTAETFYGGKRLDYSLVRRASENDPPIPTLIEAGYTHEPGAPGMLFDAKTTALNAPAALRELDIVVPDSEQTLDDYKRVAGRAFGLPDWMTERFLTPAFVTQDNVFLYLGYREGEPVSTSMLITTPGMAGIYWVATAESARRRGYGEALTYHATLQGLEQGYRHATLQASAMGAPIYARMGYTTIGHYQRHVRTYPR